MDAVQHNSRHGGEVLRGVEQLGLLDDHGVLGDVHPDDFSGLLAYGQSGMYLQKAVCT